MKPIIARRAAYFSLVLSLATLGISQKKPLDEAAYDSWKSIQNSALSNDGKWVAYRIVPQEGDAVVEVKATAIGDARSYSFPRGTNVQFSNDGHFLVATIVPKADDVKKAKKDKVKPEDMPKNGLLILNLDTGAKTELDKIAFYQIATEDSGWILYKPEPPKAEPPKAEAAKPEAKKVEPPIAQPKAEPGVQKPPSGKPGTPEKDKKPTKKAAEKPGDLMILRNLATGQEEKIENVALSQWSKNGEVLAYALSTKDGAGDAVVWYDLKSGKKRVVATGMGRYPRMAIPEDSSKLAFMTDRDDYAAKKPAVSIFLFDPSKEKAELIAKPGAPGITAGSWIAETGEFNFSHKGSRLMFATQPKPEGEKKDDTPDDEKVTVDIWNWQDPQLQSQQLLQAGREKDRSFTALYDLATKKIVQIERPDYQSATVAERKDGPVALVQSDLPYRREASWGDGYADYALVDTRTGLVKPLKTKFSGDVNLSPDGKYVIVYDAKAKQLSSIDTRTLKQTPIARDIKVPLFNELNDVPSDPGLYGFGGWTKDDARVFVYDNYDIWSVDPSGKASSMNLTKGVGRASHVRFRYVSTDPEEEFVPSDKPMLLSAFSPDTKADGAYWGSPTGTTFPTKIFIEDKLFSLPHKAKRADTVVYTRQDFVEFPDLWLADNLNFANPRKITSANPQQKDYNWGTSELVRWTSNDGVPLQGLLIKPENFDYGKKYPLITYFYERDSDTLHSYNVPQPMWSIINLTAYASNGYCVFVPDIPYKIGYPGESAVAAILPGVQSILNRGYIDPKRLGLQGQSWGGYETAFLVTQTNMFAAACSGAPVGDMFSAYGGIREGSGIVREVQYEHGQSRIAGTPWDATLRYLVNSPVFFADKVTTPLLIMSNDKDEAVPHSQGIELFTALRRLDKASWLVVYNNEYHNLRERKNRKDWTMRMQQFFDHYLKGDPEPVWMAKGVPATMKGKTFGFEPEPSQALPKPTGSGQAGG